ncbi:MAG: YaaL family protein [Lachnospiraceae bacterium]|nr:YaaL family protein [Lachnospiraceae bacterium]
MKQKRGTILHLFFQKTPKPTTYQNIVYDQLLEDMAATKYALDNAYSNFENVVDPDLIDSWIFEMNAMQKRYKFLLNRVKQMEMP